MAGHTGSAISLLILLVDERQAEYLLPVLAAGLPGFHMRLNLHCLLLNFYVDLLVDKRQVGAPPSGYSGNLHLGLHGGIAL